MFLLYTFMRFLHISQLLLLYYASMTTTYPILFSRVPEKFGGIVGILI